MSLSITDLFSTQTAQQVKDFVLGVCSDLGLVVTSWREGDPTRTVIAALSRAYAGFTETMVEAIKAGFLETATEGGLTLLAKRVYNVDRIEATFASGEVTVDNAGGGLYLFDPGEFIVKNSATGKTYANSASFTLNPLQTGLAVAIVAQEAGSDSSSAPGEIDALVTSLVSVTVTNALAVEGADEETDEALRERCLDSLGALSPDGPAAAYEYVAKTPALNGGETITRVKVLPAVGDGTLTVVIAGPDGAVAGGVVTNVQDGVDLHAVPQTATAMVESASNVALSITTDVWVATSSGLTSPQITQLVKDALVDYVPTIPIGGIDLGSGGQVLWRYLLGVIENIRAVEGGSRIVLQATLTPETDVPLTTTQVATLDDGDISVTVHLV